MRVLLRALQFLVTANDWEAWIATLFLRCVPQLAGVAAQTILSRLGTVCVEAIYLPASCVPLPLAAALLLLAASSARSGYERGCGYNPAWKQADLRSPEHDSQARAPG